MFWNFHDPQKIYPPEFMLGKKVYSCIPHRYFFVIYPVPFLFIGYVMALLSGHIKSIYHYLLKDKIAAIGKKNLVLLKKGFVVFILCFLIIPQFYLSYYFISDTYESRIWGYRCGYRVCPIYTVRLTKELVRTLIQDHGLTLKHLKENRLIFFLVYGLIDRELEIDYFFLHLEKIFPGLKWKPYKEEPPYPSGEYLVVNDQPRERWDKFVQNSKITKEIRIFQHPGINLKLYHVISDPQYPPPDYLNWRNPYFDPW